VFTLSNQAFYARVPPEKAQVKEEKQGKQASGENNKCESTVEISESNVCVLIEYAGCGQGR
jgi:hypothetical protein